ncbi:MAG: CapA family protein, partial [Oscillospiraceae bacterium]|nr:CapA family protein [Oscillospiraceae bacterium]
MNVRRALFILLILWALIATSAAFVLSFESMPERVISDGITKDIISVDGAEPAVDDERKDPPGPDEAPPSERGAESMPEPEFLSVSVAAAGDNLIHSPIFNQARRRSAEAGDPLGYDFLPAYANVMDLIAGHDIAIINQETLVNDAFEPSNHPLFSTPGALGDFMLEMGFNVFGIANNHTLDKGVEGLTASLDFWRERSGRAVVVGAYYDEEDRADIRTKEINGVTFSFLAYTEHLNELRLPAGSPLQIGKTGDWEQVTEEIKKAKAVSDVCVVMLHWGIENYDQIEDEQREAAQKLAEAGADIILGTHPHVLRDIEFIRRSDGTEALVVYSLANFISAQNIPQTMIGGVVTFEVAVNSITREVEIKDVLLTPTITHFDAGYSNVRIYPLSGYDQSLASAHGVRAFGTFSLDYIYNSIRWTVSRE